MEKLHVRPARADDEPLIGALLVGAFDEAYARKMPSVRLNEERYEELRGVGRLRDVGAVLVGTVDDELVATVTVLPDGAPHWEGWSPGDANLRFLAVLPRLHGRGLAQPMMDAAEAVARDWQVPGIGLHVRRGAKGVARLYTARGYQRAAHADLDLLPLVFLEAYRLPLGVAEPLGAR